MSERRQRCKAVVWKRDTYRRTGRGKSGFSMHYEQCQCQRAAVHAGRCKQHADKVRFSVETDWYQYVD